MRQDIRAAFRQFRRNPGFAAIAIAMLALGIGTSVAVFSILDAVLLKPLPFRNADRLVDILEVQRKGTAEQITYSGMTRMRLADWRAQTHIFEAIEADRSPRPFTLGTSDTIYVSQVSAGLFSLLGLTPTLGRTFSADEAARNDTRVVLISDGLWRRLFAADPQAVGREIAIEGRNHTITGVMPPEAMYPFSSRLDAWIPLSNHVDPQDPSSAYVGVVALLRPGLTTESVQPLLDEAAQAIQTARPARTPWAAAVESIDPRQWRREPLVLVMFGAVTFVVLAACANLASLLLARAAGRQREIAVRRALGATRFRVARLLMFESLMLATAGGVAAALPATWLIESVPALLPERSISFYMYDMTLDWRVFGYGVLATLFVGLAAGLLPAFRGSEHTGASTTLSGEIAVGRTPHGRLRRVLLGTQVAFAIVLLIGAGLLTASFRNMVRSEAGYRLDGLFEISVRLPNGNYSKPPQISAVFESWLESVRALDGVTAATLGTPPPSHPATSLVPERAEDPPENQPRTLGLSTGLDYFRTVGIDIVLGRDFTEDERNSSLPVVIIDEEAARRFWPSGDPLGKRVRIGGPGRPWLTVVGVARDIKTGAVGRAGDALEAYAIANPGTQSLSGTLMFRTSGDARQTFAAARAMIQGLEPGVNIESAGAVEELYGPALMAPRFAGMMMSLFAALALLTSAVGVYGMLSYDVAQRIVEIGIRMALGADAANVRRLVVFTTIWPVIGGLTAGVLIAQWLTRFVEWRFLQVRPHDPATLVAVGALFVAVAVVASYVPARRATRVDPVVALRRN